jgi:hypothetical protein
MIYCLFISSIFISFVILHSVLQRIGKMPAKKENKKSPQMDKPVSRHMTNELQIPVCPSQACSRIRTNYCGLNDALLFVEVSHSKPCQV